MSSRVYEGMFILDSNHYARDPSGVSGKVAKMVQDCGGEILVSRLWAEQKFAYPIDGHRKGTYWLTYFRMESSKQKDLVRQCHLNESVLRNLVLTVDERLVETLVQHALSGGPTRSSSEVGDEPRRSRRVEIDAEVVDIVDDEDVDTEA